MISRATYRERFANVIRYDFKESKRPELVFNTLNSDDVESMIEEMESVACRSKRVEKPCAHFCFSLAPGEVLSPEQWAEFFAAVVEEFCCLQAVGVVHHDTPQINAHLVMNRVKADGKAWGTSNDRKRLRALCTRFEKQFALRILPDKSTAPRISKTELEKADRLHRQGKSPTPIPARMELAETVRAVLSISHSPEDFTQKLSRHGITVRWRIENDIITGSSYARGDISITGKNAGITVRAVREQFSRHEPDRITTPGGPASTLARHPERTAPQRTYHPEQRAGTGAPGIAAPEPAYRKAHRNHAHDRRDAAPAPQPSALVEILSEASRYGTLGLLGLLDLILASADDSRRVRSRHRPPQPFIPFPL
ncbi:MAG: relaxase/mobilization nuclease domain-containing protein [Verrucomicrobia bacterium]|nr:relaxase/mobilization nuclease domain-containing protein [Verrucomicrobiota bacterium]